MELNIQTYAPSVHKLKVLLYGASGAGKTHFAATAPKPFFINAENGLLSAQKVLAARGEQVKGYGIKTIQDLRDVLAYLRTEKHGFETVIIDSISEINEIIKEGIETKNKRSMQLQDWGTLSKEIKLILRSFRDLDMHVLFLAQESYEKDDQTIKRIVPLLNGKAATEAAYYMDIVGYAFIKDGKHVVTTAAHDKLITKDRSSSLDGIEQDFSLWVAAVCTDAPASTPAPAQPTKVEAPADVTPPPELSPWKRGLEDLYTDTVEMIRDLCEFTGQNPEDAEVLCEMKAKQAFKKTIYEMTKKDWETMQAAIDLKMADIARQQEAEHVTEPTT